MPKTTAGQTTTAREMSSVAPPAQPRKCGADATIARPSMQLWPMPTAASRKQCPRPGNRGL
eukprot:4404908-Alexandrium_andersonii.AAC.1